MLLKVSEDLAKKKELISNTLGKPFNLQKRKELEGTVLSNIAVTAASIDLYNIMVLHEDKIICNLEMRPKGIVISFRVKNDMYSLVIPFYKLKIYKGKAEEYSFYKDHYFIKIWAGADQAEVHKFVKKIKIYQTDTSFPRIEDIL